MSTSPETFLFWGQSEEEWSIDKTTEYQLCIRNTVDEIGPSNVNDYNFTSLIFQSPSFVEIIHHFAFCDCNNLSRIHFPEGLEDILHHAFSDCKNLRNINFPSTLKSIGANCFKGCHNLSLELQLPNSLEAIGDLAFDTHL